MFEIVKATEKDCAVIGQFIRDIAEYEKLSDQVIWDEDTLFHQLFVEKNARVLLAKENDKVIGFALYFFNFSTFIGRKGLYLEDLFIQEAYRKKGYGKALFHELAKIAVAEHCGRMEWVCLNWNQPSIDFYHSLGAIGLNEWTTYRLQEDQLHALAAQEKPQHLHDLT